MNRRKKVNQILKKRAKQKTTKLNPRSKSAYIAKAEREGAEAQAAINLPTGGE